MVTKKVILFIVEGFADQDALRAILTRIYRGNHEIRFCVVPGDVTSAYSSKAGPDGNPAYCTIEEVKSRIKSTISEGVQDLKLKRKDIFQVIHLVDTDGAFAPDTCVVYDASASKFRYSETNIFSKQTDFVIDRNHHKVEMLRELIGCGEIDKYPYKVYFMSCNLDHALYNIPNLPLEEKTEQADAFYERFIGREMTFIDFLKSDVVNGVPDSYPASWRYIQEGMHSLERHTNLHILFKEHPIL